MRENWPVSPEQRQAFPKAIADALRLAADAPADAGLLEKYHWKIGHRFSG